jgi:hypothetical protein
VTIGEKEYTAVVPPGGANRGSQYLIDKDGNWYRLSSARGRRAKVVDARPGGQSPSERRDAREHFVQGQTTYAFRRHGDDRRKEYTAVVPPGEANRGSQYLVDNDGNWYRLSSARDAEPKAVDALPGGTAFCRTEKTVLASSSSSTASLEYLRFGPWEKSTGRCIARPGAGDPEPRRGISHRQEFFLVLPDKRGREHSKGY